MSAGQDRGLKAVARVREIRERDSRLGLQQALLEQQQRERRLAALEEQVREHGAFVSGDMQQFVALRYSLTALREATSQARRGVETAAALATSAQEHWRNDKTKLSAVEGLLERRTEERRAEAAVELAKELDDVAGRLWLRRSRAEGTA